jgi:hypothetical protein
MNEDNEVENIGSKSESEKVESGTENVSYENE